MTQAVAQGGEAATGQSAIDEIIVTATKRGEGSSIQDTAMSISALGKEIIKKRGLVGMNDYLRTLPGVNIIDTGVGRNAIIVRGISADPQIEGFNTGPTVGVYLGDTPIAGYASGSTSDLKMVDIDRVEVLRGPQGTLYGSSSLAGTVRNIPTAPNLSSFSGDVSMGYSNTSQADGGNTKFVGAINIPLISDKFAVRAVVYRFEESGHIKNIAGSNPVFVATAAALNVPELAVDKDDIGHSNYRGFRFTALFQPIDNLATTFTYIKQNLDQEGFPESDIDLGTYTQSRYQLGSLVGGGERLADDVEIVSLSIEYDFSLATVTSTSSWVEEQLVRNTDLSSLVGVPLPQDFSNEADVFTEELRIASKFNGPAQFVAGLYYEDTESGFSERDYWGGDQAFNSLDPTTPLLGAFDDSFTLEQKAIFGEVSYDITDQVVITAGLRAFEYEKIDTKIRSGFLAGGSSTSMTDLDDSGTTYKLGVAYTNENDDLFYANWAEGFRLGRSVATLPTTCDANNDGIIDGTTVPITHDKTDPDTLETYEVGGKFTFNEGALLNIALYQSNWDGIPINVVGTCVLSTVVNAGKARVQGMEVEAVIYATSEFRLDISGSYVNAELTDNAPGVGGAVGDRLPGSPEYTFNLGAQYDFSVAGKAAYVRSDYSYVGKFYNNLKEVGDAAGGYHQLNLRTGLAINNFNLDLYINNLTNADEFTWVDSLFTVNRRATVLRPRTIGLNLGYEF